MSQSEGLGTAREHSISLVEGTWRWRCYPRPFWESQKDQIGLGRREFAVLSPQYKTNGISPVSQDFSVCIVPVFVMLVCAYICAGDIFLCVRVGARGHWVSLFPRARLPTEYDLPVSQNC